MTFLHKYLKYKKKYLNLKRIIQKGGVFEKDGKKMVRIDTETNYEVQELKCKLEEKGLIGAEAIKKYKGNPGKEDDKAEQTGKIGVKTFFEAGYTFQELKDGGFNINNFINSGILNPETKSGYTLDWNDIKNILKYENNLKKLLNFGFEPVVLENLIKSNEDKFAKIYNKILKNKKIKNFLSKIYSDDIQTLKKKFNFTAIDFITIGKNIKDILDYFSLEQIIKTYFDIKKTIPEETVNFLIEKKYKEEHKYTIEQIFEITKLKEAVLEKYTIRQLGLSISDLKNLIGEGLISFKILAKEYTIQELWDKFPDHRSILSYSFKSETDRIKAREKYKAEHNGEEPTDEFLDKIIEATNEEEKKRLEELYKAKIEKERKEKEQERINKIKNQIKAYNLKKLKDSGVSIQDIAENPDNNIEAILMVFTSKEIIEAGLEQFYPNLDKIDLYNYAKGWLDDNFNLLDYGSEVEYERACSFMHDEASPRYLALLNDGFSTDHIIKKHGRPELIKRINISLEKEYMSSLHPYWEILQRRVREMDYKSNKPNEWIDTATEEDMERFLSDHP